MDGIKKWQGLDCIFFYKLWVLNIRFQNIQKGQRSKINTDDYLVYSSFQDGSRALKKEIQVSVGRMKAAMNGHSINSS